MKVNSNLLLVLPAATASGSLVNAAIRGDPFSYTLSVYQLFFYCKNWSVPSYDENIQQEHGSLRTLKPAQPICRKNCEYEEVKVNDCGEPIFTSKLNEWVDEVKPDITCPPPALCRGVTLKVKKIHVDMSKPTATSTNEAYRNKDNTFCRMPNGPGQYEVDNGMPS